MSPASQKQVPASLVSASETRIRALVCRVRSRLCALPLAHVVETMRPLPVEPLSSTLPFVTGIAIIRGIPVPVVDAGAVLGTGEPPNPSRFVSLQVDGRSVALAVEGVVGIRDLTAEVFGDLPPLLREVAPDVVSAIGVLDAAFLAVLRATCILPDSTWSALAGAKGDR
jgi:purine-binding chemotaxis protein CheW